MGTKHVAVAALMSALVVGCGTSDQDSAFEPSVGTTEAALVVANGSQLNGSQLNGSQLNGPTLNQRLVSVSYAGAKRTGMGPLDEVWLEGSTLHGLLDTDELSGVDFQGMQFVGNLENGGTVTLRVDSVIPGSGAQQDVWSYKVSFQDPTDMKWYPICTGADGSPAGAIALENRWDYRQGVSGGGSKIHDATAFTFACEGAAIAKCVHYGYKPWQSVNGVSLEDYHQTCTRMIRADFCGNGTSYTQDGKWVNLYDSLNVQTDTESWTPEAEWNAQGASCFTSQTRATAPIQCADGRLVTSCGTSFSANTLLISETP
ncbi:ADYC domain-containing protein [Hyalangium gracile]|uniref:ADYC domain-containing protein n=1 Tax=Hyalangium gracile TaxID=394092 RepID=UPI001CCB1263|nr:ADYC domain-containing protein [Hyalangium gracile]